MSEIEKGSMSTVTGRRSALAYLAGIGIPALTVIFGIQALRVMIPGLVWLLFDHMDWGISSVGIVALAVFLPAFFAGGIQRFPGYRLSIVVTAGGLGLLRLLMQVWSTDPVVNLSLAMAGVTLFTLFLPTYFRNVLTDGSASTGRFAMGLLLGLALDTALHGTFDSYDLNWQADLLPLLLVVLLVLVQWMLLTGVTHTRGTDTARGTVGTNKVAKALPFLAIGPFLFLQLVIFQNVASVAVVTDWRLPAAFGLTLLGQLAGLAAASWLLSRTRLTRWLWSLVSGIGLVAILSVPYTQAALPAAFLLLFGQVLLSLLIVLVFAGMAEGVGKAGLRGFNTISALSMILLLLLLAVYYMVYQFELSYSNTFLGPLAAFVVGLCAVVASKRLRSAVSADYRSWLVAVIALPLVILPLVGTITWRTPETVSGEGYPVRVMTYNLHNGFNTEGFLGMEDLAGVIEDSKADIIALQEVSRGWVINGRVDMLEWLSHRLNMPYVFGPTAGPYWGNAILSRYPILEYTEYDLPPRDLPVLRGLMEAVVDLGNGDRLRVLATHYHHVDEDSDVRQLQARETVEIWDGEGLTVLLGDLNARPGDPEMEMLLQAGLIDALAGIEPPPAYTWPSFDPDQRIDYIWTSPDLNVNDIQVIASKASDHLAVVAEVGRRIPADGQ